MSITRSKDIQYACGFEIYFNLAVTPLGIYLIEILEQVPETCVVAKLRNNPGLINTSRVKQMKAIHTEGTLGGWAGKDGTMYVPCGIILTDYCSVVTARIHFCKQTYYMQREGKSRRIWDIYQTVIASKEGDSIR